jgi:hypothetical protein
VADPLPHEPVSMSWEGRGWHSRRPMLRRMCSLAHLRDAPDLHVRLAHMQQLVIVKPRRKG